MGTVVVTGAAGFIGAEVCRRLASSGHLVRALVRRPGDTGRVSREGVSATVVGDLEYNADSADLFRGAFAVVHLAARVHRRGEQSVGFDAAYERTNTQLTRQIAQAAVRAGVSRFVFMSSVKAVGERSHEGAALQRTAPPRPEDAYGRSKLAAERALEQIAAEQGLAAAVLRPPLVYGPSVGANFRELVRWVARGLPMPFDAVVNRRSIMSVWNLADCVARAVSLVGSGFRVYHVSDDRPVSTPELIRMIAHGLGRAPRLFAVPPVLLRAALHTLGRRGLAERLLGSLELETTESCAELGWRPALSVEQGVEKAVREMRL